MSGRLEGKTALVTGGGSGIGRAICIRFAEEGARVAVVDLDKEGAGGTIDLCLNDSARAYTCDISNTKDTAKTFAQAADDLGPLDIVVNNAGIAHIGNIEQCSESDLDRLYGVNVKGVFNGMQAAVTRMKRRGGSILNMASVVSKIGIPDRFAYSMTKGAVLTMTYSVAIDYIKEGIRCNCIAPGRVHTPFVDAYLSKNYPGEEREMFARLAATQPIGRMGSPEEIAGLCVYLCSDEASFITGSCYDIDGGFVSLKP